MKGRCQRAGMSHVIYECRRARREKGKGKERGKGEKKKKKSDKVTLTCTPSHLTLGVAHATTGADRVTALGFIHVSEKTGLTSRRRPRFRAPNGLVPSMSCNRSSHAVPMSRKRRHEPMPHPTKRRRRTTKVMTKPKK